ncbi:phosphatase PAP2 family protein [Opitutus sp. ER46]|uniref:phosphatase PAP2 family protein n=1 Tax=Opitutus sp. ER46 TaxID=2161864 RepID=UPI000D318FC5|nr:phosphatase PAP2 family protein [Opitutus sp. ER46]PTX91703.1 hypothetical protein DB354_17720 [Opitutus sp. ER46]
MSKSYLGSWVLVVLLLVGYVAPLAAKPASFLPPEAARVLDQIPAPPADDSIAGRADLETLLQVQKDRTPAQVARADKVAEHSPMEMGLDVFGAWFTEENLPQTAAILKQVRKECHPLLTAAKERWLRVRPFNRDARIKPCVKLPSGTSYPSGHSSSAAIWSVVFSAAFPERAAEFDAATRETMWCRVLGGVHYPSDTQAGYVLGTEIGRQLLTTPAMQRAIATMRAEVQAFAAKHPQGASGAAVETPLTSH